MSRQQGEYENKTIEEEQSRASLSCFNDRYSYSRVIKDSSQLGTGGEEQKWQRQVKLQLCRQNVMFPKCICVLFKIVFIDVDWSNTQ